MCSAALRALFDTVDPELLPDLLKVACETSEHTPRTLAIRGCVRLATQEEPAKVTGSKRIETFKTILAGNLSNEQKRMVLAGLAEIPDVESAKLVEPMLGQDSVKKEAALALIKIASALPDSAVARNILEKVEGAITDVAIHDAAKAALKQIATRTASGQVTK